MQLHFFIFLTKIAHVGWNNHLDKSLHGSTLAGSDPHELAPGFEVCQMKGTTHIGIIIEMTLFKSYEIGLLRIRLLCF